MLLPWAVPQHTDASTEEHKSYIKMLVFASAKLFWGTVFSPAMISSLLNSIHLQFKNWGVNTGGGGGGRGRGGGGGKW